MQLITRNTQGLTPLAGDLTRQVLVLNHERLNRRYQLPRFQLFRATGGFGCKEGSLGRAVFGVFIADNEDARWDRNDFIGVATDDIIHGAMADATPVKPINLADRCYVVFAKDRSYQRGETIEEAVTRLKRITRSPVTEAYHCHPESQINDLGYLWAPAGTEIHQVKLKKQGGVWIDAS